MLSYCIDTYLRYEPVKEAIESCLKQEGDFEVLVCNDGHDDIKRNIVEKYPVRYYEIPNRQHHGGREFGTATPDPNNYGCASKNLMQSIASGEWLAFLDDDDIYYDGHLKTIEPHLKDDVGMVIYRMKLHEKHVVGRIIPCEDMIRYADISLSNFVVRTDIGNKIKWDGSQYANDYPYIKECERICLERGLKIVYLKDLLVEHRYLGDS